MSYVLDALKKADQQRGSQSFEEASEIDQILTSDHPQITQQITSTLISANKMKWGCFLLLTLASTLFIYQIFNTQVIIAGSSILLRKPKVEATNNAGVADIESKANDDEYKDLPEKMDVDRDNTVVEEATSFSSSSNHLTQNHGVSGHIYLGEGHAGNKVFIDEQSYRYGDALPNGYRVSRIGKQSMELEKNNERFNVHY